MKVFKAVAALFQSIDASVLAANRLGAAYAAGVGDPSFYTQYGAEKPQQVAMDLAGLYAADSTAHVIALLYDGQVTAETYVKALRRIDDGELSNIEKYVAKNFANATWRAGQAYRDIGTNPLNRITREINKPFALLPPDEEDKDLVQVVAGARILLEQIAVNANS